MRTDRTKRAVIIAIFLTPVMGSFLVRAVMEVQRGHGGDIFIENAYGFGISWVHLLFSCGAGFVALLIALLARAIYLWRVKRGF
jgi:hypothetical protein